MSRRDLKDGGSLVNSSSLDRTKIYTYDSTGNLVEVNGTTVVLGDNDVAFSGSKSNLRRMADLERNVSILATRLIDTSGYTFDVSGTLGTNFTEKLQDVVGGMVTSNTETGITVTYDDTTGKLNFSVTDNFVNTSGDTMSGILNMGGNLIQNLATPISLTDAATKGYIDSQLSGVAEYTSWTISDGTFSEGIADGDTLTVSGSGATSVSYNVATNTLTISSTDTDTDTTYSAGSGITLTDTTFSHTDTSSVSNLTASGRRYVTGLTFDTFGHVTGVTTGTETVVNTDTNDIDYINAASFNTSTGVLTLSGVGNAGATVDLDGRYQPKVTISGTAPTGASVGDLWYDDTTDLKIFIYTGTEWVDTVPTAQNNYVTSLAFNAGDGVLTATREGLTNLTVDLDGRYLTSETVTSLSLSSNTLSYVDENGATTNIDLSLYIDDTNLARLVSGTVNGTTGIATFTRDDASTFTVDFSALFDDTNLTRITSGGFDPQTGNLALTRSDATTAATVNLDGRYLLSSNYEQEIWTTDASFNTSNGVLTFNRNNATSYSVDLDNRYLLSSDYVNKYTQAVAFNASTGDFTLTLNDATALTMSLDGRYLLSSNYEPEIWTTDASFNTSNGVLTFNRNNATSYSVDLDGRYDNYGSWTISDGTASEAINSNDTLTIAGSGSTTTSYNSATNTLTISSTGTAYTAGTGLSLVGTTFNNTAPDQVVSLTGTGATTVTGTYPNFTIGSTDSSYVLPTATSTVKGGVELFSDTVQSVAATAVSATASRTYGIQLNAAGQAVVNVPWVDTNTTYTAGTGLTLSGTTFSNTAPDQTVTLTGSGATSVSGTYPNFTISSTDTDTVYTLPAATSTVRGGIELFSDTVQSVAANAVSATASRTYGVQVNASGQAVVNVPWTNTETESFKTQTVTDTDTGYTWAATGSAVADNANDTLTWVSGSGIDIDVDATADAIRITNTAPDQTVTLTGSGATSVSGTYPNFTISSTDTNTVYTLPAATSTVRGGIELFSDTVQSVAANAVTATASRTYGVQVNSAGQAVVNVPWVDTNTNTTYTAGTGLSLTGTTFSVDSTIAPKTYVDTAISNLVNGADAAYDTLLEIQNAMATDAELSAAISAITIGNGTVTVNTGSGLTGSGSFTMNQTGATTVTLSHADTSTAANLTASGRTYVSGLTFDTYGHVTGYTTGTETVVDTNTTSLPVENSAGTVQFTSTQATGIQFAGSGATSVAFDAANQRVTISSTDTNTDTTYTAGTGLSLTGTTFSNTAPDQVVSLTGSGATSVSGTYPNFTISSTDTNTVYTLPEATSTVRGGIELFSDTDQAVAANAVSATAGRTYGVQLNSAGQAVVNVPWTDTDTNTTYSAGSGITLTGTTFSNAAPDVTVTLTGSGATSVSGTYPNFTISSTDTDTVYTLPAATSTTLGGIKLEDDTVQTTAANAVTTTASRTYGVQVNASGQAVVNVPWVDTNTVYTLPEATSTVRGGIELFSDTDQAVAANAVSATAGRTYGIQLNSAGQAVVNVPWVDTNTETESFRTQTVTDTDTGYTWAATGSAVADSPTDTLTWVSGGAIDIDVDAALDAIRITHSDTSSVTNLTASSRRYVTGLTFDTYGHVTGYTTGTETVTDTNNYVTGLSFNTSDGVLTATRSGLSNLTVDLDGRYQLSGAYLTAESDTLDSVTTRGNVTSNGIEVGSVTMGDVLLDNASVTTSTTAQTPVILYSTAGYGAKIVVRARDTVSGAIHVSELLIANTGSVAVATEYGSVFTSAALATYDVDVSAGNVRLLVTSASANSTQYNISITGM